MEIHVILLIVGLVISIIYILLIKRDVGNINRALKIIEAIDSSMCLTTETFDADIVELCNRINSILGKLRENLKQNERTNTAMKRAITNITHDLRTPLTTVIGYLQLLGEKNTPPRKKSEYLAIIQRRLASLTLLMNSLFDYTQIIEGRVELRPEMINLNNILRDTISLFYDDFISTGFVVEVDIPDEPIYAVCDLTAYLRISQNLIRNALEHGNGRFKLSLTENGALFSNQTENIDALDPQIIFERFYTSDSSRSTGNVGLGLAIVKELTNSINGSIEAYKQDDMLCIRLVV